MNTKRYILFLIVIIIGLASTTCEGPIGPMGPQGPQGEQGPPGPVGPAGTDGSIILAGQGAPDENTGKPGDFYLDLATGNLYGPKMVEGWGTPTNLQGPQGPAGPQGPQGPEGPQGPPGEDGEDGKDGEDGQDGKDGKDGEDGKDGADGQDGEDGKDGSRIYAGNGAPDNSLGKKGDYYLDKTNYDLYGPKTGSGWGVPVNLQGPQGDQGPAGPPGTNGVSGWERVGGGCKSATGVGQTAQIASCPAGQKVLGGGLAVYRYSDDSCSDNPTSVSTISSILANSPYSDTEWYVGFSFNSPNTNTYYQVWAICAIVN